MNQLKDHGLLVVTVWHKLELVQARMTRPGGPPAPAYHDGRGKVQLTGTWTVMHCQLPRARHCPGTSSVWAGWGPGHCPAAPTKTLMQSLSRVLGWAGWAYFRVTGTGTEVWATTQWHWMPLSVKKEKKLDSSTSNLTQNIVCVAIFVSAVGPDPGPGPRRPLAGP